MAESAFTTNGMGEWKLGDDGRMIRLLVFAVARSGYGSKRGLFAMA